MTIAIVVVLSIWFVLTVANQVHQARRRLNGTLNSFGVLPSLGLFAPEPRDVDYHLVWRDRRADGTYGAWSEIVVEPGGAARAIWNPTSREVGALLQIVAALSILNSAVVPACRNAERIVLVSLPYLILLNVALAQPRAADAVARQFAVLETTGFGAARTVELGISSPLHPLEPG
jgi:hypothetical protein